MNPFFWHTSSKAVQSAVVDIRLQTDNNKILNVSSLKTPVSIILVKNKQASNLFKTENASSFTPYYFLKPPTNTNENMRYHRITIPSPYVTATLYLIPQEGKEIEVFISPTKRPSPFEYNYTTKIPDLSSCVDNNLKSFKPENCSRNPYVIKITSNTTGGTGLHFIGLRILHHKSNEDPRMKIANKVLRRSILPWFNNHHFQENGDLQKDLKASNLQNENKEISKRDIFLKKQLGRQRRSCITAKDPPTASKSLKNDVQAYNPETDVRYHFSSSLSACMFWSETEERWKSDGCKVTPYNKCI